MAPPAPLRILAAAGALLAAGITTAMAVSLGGHLEGAAFGAVLWLSLPAALAGYALLPAASAAYLAGLIRARRAGGAGARRAGRGAAGAGARAAASRLLAAGCALAGAGITAAAYVWLEASIARGAAPPGFHPWYLFAYAGAAAGCALLWAAAGAALAGRIMARRGRRPGSAGAGALYKSGMPGGPA